MPSLSRRGLLGIGTAGLLLPRRLFAGAANERKFLVFFNPGGWDVVGVFAPIFNASTDHFANDEAASVGGFAITDSPTRPSVRTFFEDWGSRTCMINGMQVPSLAHHVCTMLTMTGQSLGGADDWASIIAGHASENRILPNIHVSGLFANRYASASVRVGLAGQLPSLVDGSALALSDLGATSAPSAEVAALTEALIRRRLDALATSAPPGLATRMIAEEQLARDRAIQLPGVSEALQVADPLDLYSTASVAVNALAAGLSRTGVVAYGASGVGMWDTHTENERQDGYFEELFSVLGQVLADMEAAPGESGGSLLDETTVVVLSEMGRTPQRSSTGGKDHWTWTSALLIGAGVAGGRTIGRWTEQLSGEPVDLATGEAADAGVTIRPGHLGATLLALADIDPAEFVDPSIGQVIEGALD